MKLPAPVSNAIANPRTSLAAILVLAGIEGKVAWGPPALASVCNVVFLLGLAYGFLSAADAAKVEQVAAAAQDADPNDPYADVGKGKPPGPA